MEYNRIYLSTHSASDTVNLSDKRPSDLFAIAHNSLGCSSELPSNKEISILLRQHGVRVVEVIIDPCCKWQFKAEFLY